MRLTKYSAPFPLSSLLSLHTLSSLLSSLSPHSLFSSLSLFSLSSLSLSLSLSLLSTLRLSSPSPLSLFSTDRCVGRRQFGTVTGQESTLVLLDEDRKSLINTLG